MSNNSYTYNVLIARFRDFVAGHYILQRFTHGQLSDADLAKNNLYPWLHVVPEGINFSEGTKTYNFSVMIADLPREKGEKNANQAEVISDCLQIFSDLIATIENGVLFGRDIMLGTPVNVEAFIQENSNSLTGVEGTIAITVDYNWDACDVPADFNPFTPITGEPPTYSALQFNNSLNLDGASVTLDNDVELPGNTFYYGTNAEGVKGWYALPSGSSFTCSDVDACPTIVAMLTDIANKANSADLGAVAFSNDYNDLTNLPTLFSGDYGDLTNAPALAAVATSGDYADLINTPDLSGYGDMLKSTYDVDNDGVVDMAKKEVVEVINKTGATLTKGTICYIKSTSSSGTHPEVLKANANSEATSSKTMGAIYEDIDNDAVGLLVTSGEVRNLDTSAYNTGALLWLSTTDGQVTTTPPAEPNHTVFIGHVTRSQNVNGRVLYAIQNGYELTELHGVQCPSPSTNDVLKYDGSLWVNSALTKSDVGLANVDNTSDLDKPISTATQSALDTKISSSRSFIGTLQGAAVSASGTSYCTIPFGGLSTVEVARMYVIPYDCVLSNFWVRIYTVQSANNNLVFTVRKNQVDTAIVVTIPASSAAGTEASDLVNSETFLAGDNLTVKINNLATATSAVIHNTSALITI